jgi:hypothetical protein
MLTLDYINKEASKIRKMGRIPYIILVGLDQWKDLCSFWCNGEKIIDECSQHNILFGMKVIKLSYISDYFEIQ